MGDLIDFSARQIKRNPWDVAPHPTDDGALYTGGTLNE